MSVSLRQPHGLKGLSVVAESLEPDHLPIAVGHDERHRLLDFYATLLASNSNSPDRQHAVAKIARRLEGRVEEVKVLGVVREKLSHSIVASISALDRCS
jgi:hypothetical protein